MASGGEALLQSASTFSMGNRLTMTPHDSMLSDIKNRLLIGTGVRPTELAPIVSRYCRIQAEEKPNIALDDNWVTGWERVLKASS